MIVYAIDVGSTKSGKFAWARAASGTSIAASASIDELVLCLARDLRSDQPVALGLESPLFMPLPESSASLSKGRAGEGSRTMFNQVGSTACLLGLHQLSWLLTRLSGVKRPATVDPVSWPLVRPPRLLIWEAFVSDTAHSPDHRRDAATAVAAFLKKEDRLTSDLPTDDTPVLNLAAVALLRAGWSTDLQSLNAKCLVVRPSTPYSGELNSNVNQP